MPVVEASQQALIHASTKDALYLQILRGQLNTLAQQLLGANFLIQWSKELVVISDVLYFMLTTVQGSQTLGEEYTSIIQVDSSKRKIPSKMQRLMLVLLQCTSPYLLEKTFQKMEKSVERQNGISKLMKAKLIICCRLLYKLIPVLQKVHLALFYMDGIYANIALRVTKIKHILIRPYNDKEHDVSTFRWLAIMLGIQILTNTLSLIFETRKGIAEAERDTDSNEESESTAVAVKGRSVKTLLSRNKTKCLLCLEVVVNVSVTMCGHLFCWKCIIDWCVVKPECPSCRQHCPPSRVVCLHHFTAS